MSKIASKTWKKFFAYRWQLLEDRWLQLLKFSFLKQVFLTSLLFRKCNSEGWNSVFMRLYEALKVWKMLIQKNSAIMMQNLNFIGRFLTNGLSILIFFQLMEYHCHCCSFKSSADKRDFVSVSERDGSLQSFFTIQYSTIRFFPLWRLFGGIENYFRCELRSLMNFCLQTFSFEWMTCF